MIGPVLIHTRKEYSSYFHLPSLILQAQPTLKNIKVVGSDSEKNVYLLFRNLMPDTYSLLCDIHMKDNLMGKGSKLNLSKEQMKEILNDIFCRNVGEIIEKGLVHHSIDFDLKLDHLREKWMGFGEKGNQFHNYFILHKVEGIHNCMSSELRSMAGLGYLPKPYTQNANQCINSVIKPRESQKCKSIIDVVNRVRDIVMKQEAQVNLSVVGQGEWTLDETLTDFAINDRYFQMSQQQKERFIKMFSNTPPVASASSGQLKNLSLSPNDTGILYPTFEILRNIFVKAESLLERETSITSFSGMQNAYFVESKSNPKEPHKLKVYSNGNVKCDNSCLQYESYKICSHSIDNAEKYACLKTFVVIVKEKPAYLNDLINSRQPVNTGKKNNLFYAGKKRS